MWRRTLAGGPADQVLIDLGTSTITGLCAPGAPELAKTVHWVGHPVLQTLALDTSDTAALGSSFSRAGLLYERPPVTDDVFTDRFGVDWLSAEGSAAPLNHPLQGADYLQVARHPRPIWPDTLQVPDIDSSDPGRPLIVADAPTAGLLETCFGLRDTWQFMLDITDNWRVANALLDWALESVASAYEHMFARLPISPDVVIYGDDYGYQGGMFLSDNDFRSFVRPRLRTLFSRIRRATSAAICFHCCGAIQPILTDLADLGVEILNLQYDAKGMELHNVRAELPREVVLHGYTDLCALGKSVVTGERRGIAVLTEELIASAPVIAAPVDNLASEADLMYAAAGARFVLELTPDDIEQIRQIGPVKSILDRATEAALSRPIARPTGSPPIATSIHSDAATVPQLAR
ncbi:hypothetical protein BH09ACT8_BH09ACT8_22790 [soil metagenome]